MTSLWLDRAGLPTHPPLTARGRFDVVVAGAGLTGLSTALLLARSGCSVVVLEGRTVGAGTTGNTTAKVSLLQGTRLSQIAAKHSAPVVRDYVEANREGQAWLLRYCAEHSVPVERRAAFTYAAGRLEGPPGGPAHTSDGRRAVEAELIACQEAGLPVTWRQDLDLPYPTSGAVELSDQAQVDPMALLSALVADLQHHGGVIHEHTRVQGVRSGTGTGSRTGCVVLTDRGEVDCDHLALATGTPVLDRGGFFARLEPRRSYAMAFRVPGELPAGMYLSADSPTRSVRTAVDPATGDRLLLTGGNGHVVGREQATSALVADLTQWTERWFPGAQRTHWWSAQDYSPVDALPYVGRLTPTSERVLVATGYDKWGMTNAVAASLALSAVLLGGHMPWAQALRSWQPHELVGAVKAATLGAGVAVQMASDWLRPRPAPGQRPDPPEGQGRVETQGLQPVAVCTVQGVTRRASAVCPHLRGVLSWNDAERSWDCPLHGSRFAADGAVLEGPATRGMQPL